MERNDDPIPPARLKDDLSALYRTEVRVPLEVDRLVTSGARAHLARRGRWVRWAGAGAAVAAAMIVSMILLHPHDGPGVAQTAARSVIVGDANADGHVDIRDALSLARRIEAGSVPPTARHDVNHDQIVDRRDVDAIAMMSVSLGAEVVR